MGICSSCESTSVATAKLILQDGRLQEFSYPVKVSYVLQKDPTIFVCNSDEMEFDDVVSALSDDEELQPGQLYFALPLTRSSHPLQPEEMASLAVKASYALSKSGGEKCGCRRKAAYTLAFMEKKSNVDQASRKMTYGGGCVGDGGLKGGRRSGARGRRRNFWVALSAIQE